MIRLKEIIFFCLLISTAHFLKAQTVYEISDPIRNNESKLFIPIPNVYPLNTSKDSLVIPEKYLDNSSNNVVDYIESYPKKGEPSASSFKGPMKLYKRNDFKIYKEYETYYVMRKTLSI